MSLIYSWKRSDYDSEIVSDSNFLNPMKAEEIQTHFAISQNEGRLWNVLIRDALDSVLTVHYFLGK